MNRRRIQAILKVTLCASLLPGCSAVRAFQKDRLASKDSIKKTETARNWTNDSYEDLIPPHPGGRDVPNEMEITQVAHTGTEEPKPRIVPVIDPPVPLLKSAKPDDDNPIVQAVRHALHDRHNDALKCLEPFEPATQDLLLRLLPMLAALKDKGLDKLSAEEIGNFHEQLEGLLNTLRPRTDLAIEKLCCCEGVKGFGDYTPLTEGHLFRPDELVWLYLELRNFCAESFCETRLSSRVRIHDPKNPDLKPHEFVFDEGQRGKRVPRTLNAYYQSLRFAVPHLPAGVYTLTLTVTDDSQADRRRVAEKSMEFRVR